MKSNDDAMPDFLIAEADAESEKPVPFSMLGDLVIVAVDCEADFDGITSSVGLSWLDTNGLCQCIMTRLSLCT
jgi:tRNA G37 N-methylase Trm5